MQGPGGGGFRLQNSHSSTYYGSPVTALDRFLSGQNNNRPSQDSVVYDDVVVSSNGLCGFWSSNDYVMGSGGYGYVPLLPPCGSDHDHETTSFVDGVLLDCESLQWEADQERNNKEMVTTKMSRSGGKRVSRAALIKGQWTDEEDRKLIKLVKQYGMRKWAKIAESLFGRAGKQCRERWHNHLRPDIKKDRWSSEEERILVEVHEKIGNRWAEIAKVIPGRSENTIKNHWNATIRKLKAYSRRKSKHQSAKDPTEPSVLQQYIRTKLNLGNNNNNIGITKDTKLLCNDDIAPSTASSEDDPSSPLICDEEMLFMLNLFSSSSQNSDIISDVLNVVPKTRDGEVPLVPNFGIVSEEVSGASSTQLCSDVYLSYLLNETGNSSGSSKSWKNVMGLGMEGSEVAYCSSTVTTDHNVKKEMDLMEMVSSSQTSNYSCSSCSFRLF